MENEIAPATTSEQSSDRPVHHHHDQMVKVLVRAIPGESDVSFEIESIFTLGDVLRKGAEKLHVHLLPNVQNPLDELLNQKSDGSYTGPLDLQELIEEFLRKAGTAHRFGIKLALLIRINSRWVLATSEEMTPRQILALPGTSYDPTAYTLYLHDSNVPLPLDTPIKIGRGEKFEVQKDGKYGGGRCPRSF